MIRDLRLALRWLKRNPLFATAVVSCWPSGSAPTLRPSASPMRSSCGRFPMVLPRIWCGWKRRAPTGLIRNARKRLSALARSHGPFPDYRAVHKGHGDAECDRHTGPGVRAADFRASVFAARRACPRCRSLLEVATTQGTSGDRRSPVGPGISSGSTHCGPPSQDFGRSLHHRGE